MPITATGLFGDRGRAAGPRDPVDRVLQLAREATRCTRASRSGSRRPAQPRRADARRRSRPPRRRRPRRTAAPPSARSYSSNSMPGGRSSAASSRSLRLCDSRRRLPLIPRTLIVVTPAPSPARGRRSRVTSLSRIGPPLGSSMFQLIPNDVRSMVVSRWRPILSPPGPATGPAIVPVSATGCFTPRISSSPSTTICVAVDADLGRRERDAREALGVEEVGREQVALEVLVLHGDAGDVGAAAQLALVERGVEVGQAALEERHAAVPHRVRRRTSGPVERPRPGREGLLGQCGGGHVLCLLCSLQLLASANNCSRET